MKIRDRCQFLQQMKALQKVDKSNVNKNNIQHFEKQIVIII